MDNKLWTPKTPTVLIREPPKKTEWLSASLQELEQKVADQLRGFGFNVK